MNSKQLSWFCICLLHISSLILVVKGFHHQVCPPCRHDKWTTIDGRLFAGKLQETPRKEEASVASHDFHLAFPGGGIMFYWQAGVITYLRENQYDLNSCSFSGASAGALTATLASAEVNFYEATDLALQLASDAGVWDRPGGLQGIWGPIIFEWLEALLPDTIDCVQGRLSLLVNNLTVTPIPSFGKKKISSFIDKNDLIRCNMASVHLPWFLDGKLTSSFRESPHIDGSFLAKPSDFLPQDQESEILFIDWKKDPIMNSKGGFDIVEALSPDGIYGLLDQGKVHAKVMESRGCFQNLKKKDRFD